LPSDWRLVGDLFLLDRPGELAEVATLAATCGANIGKFHYNRSENANLVHVAATLASARAAGDLAEALRARGSLALVPAGAKPGAEITDLGGLLRIKVNLEDRAGALAAFACVLKDHRTNVIYMSYDADQAPGLAEMAMATESADEVSRLLKDLNERGYHYHVAWQGANSASIDEVIGLSLVERFLLALKKVLPRDKIQELEEFIRSSEDLRQTLLSFKREAGESDEAMAASEVFTNILQLATASISKTGRGFWLRLTGPLELTPRVALYMLSCPTGANGYLLKTAEELVLIDSSYGLYWRDAKQWLTGHGIDPSRIRRALFTHSDADHAGWAAPLEEECGTEIYMHPGCRAVFEHQNRAFGSGTRLMALNGYYTRLVNRFTDLRAPREIRPFPAAGGQVGDFKIIGRLGVADLELQVLESHGGHVPAQVFFYAPTEGLLFCGDYLIDFRSLSERTKSTLSIARFLMTSTNSDGRVFGREMRELSRLILDANTRLQKLGGSARLFPGHGDFYSVDEADWLLKEVLAPEENPPPAP
jgi:glyoxylase-like metal-dependent hydrolase (beta-lactamase superfamily II)/glycine cleavage system regulatory protein